MQTVHLDKKRHNRKDFDCEVDALNEYLYSMANQHNLKDNTRTYILEDSENPSNIVGYYTLTMTTIELTKLGFSYGYCRCKRGYFRILYKIWFFSIFE